MLIFLTLRSKAIHVSTAGWESQDSDTDDDDIDCPKVKNDEYEAELCNAFTLLSFDGIKQKANEEPEINELADESRDNSIDNDCSLLANVSKHDQEHSNNDDCDSSTDSSATLELSSGNEEEPHCFPTHGGGGDADFNSVSIFQRTALVAMLFKQNVYLPVVIRLGI